MLVKYKDLNNYNLKSNNCFYTIAEIGINHSGSLEKAKKLVESAAKANVNAVKFQTYKAENRVGKDSPLYDILKECELSFIEFEKIKRTAEDNGVTFFSTPFDEESVKFLKSINCEIFKIASFDSSNKKLIKIISSISKTSILSTGLTNLEELNQAYDILNKNNNKVVLLHCVSSYPTKPIDSNLQKIHTLQKNFDCLIGQSDHTDDILIPLFAAAKGAQVIEKHFKIDNEMQCPDAIVSITQEQMKNLNDNLDILFDALGSEKIKIHSAEKDILQFKRFS